MINVTQLYSCETQFMPISFLIFMSHEVAYTADFYHIQ